MSQHNKDNLSDYDFINSPFECMITAANPHCINDVKTFFTKSNVEFFVINDNSNHPNIICRFPNRKMIYAKNKNSDPYQQEWFVDMVEKKNISEKLHNALTEENISELILRLRKRDVQTPLECTFVIPNLHCQSNAIKYLDLWNAQILNIDTNDRNPKITCRFTDRMILHAAKGTSLTEQSWLVDMYENVNQREIKERMYKFINDRDYGQHIEDPLKCMITISNDKCIEHAKTYFQEFMIDVIEIISERVSTQPKARVIPKIICNFPNRESLYVQNTGVNLFEQKWFVELVEISEPTKN